MKKGTAITLAITATLSFMGWNSATTVENSKDIAILKTKNENVEEDVQEIKENFKDLKKHLMGENSWRQVSKKKRQKED